MPKVGPLEYGDPTKENVWIMTTKPSCTCTKDPNNHKEDANYKCSCAAKPGLTDPLQLYSLFEIVDSDGSGPDAVLTCRCVDLNYDKPLDFLADFSHVSGHGLGNDAVSMKDGKKPHSDSFELGVRTGDLKEAVASAAAAAAAASAAACAQSDPRGPWPALRRRRR